MNITIKVNSPKLIQTMLENLLEVHHSELGKILSGLLKAEVTTRVARKFESKINRHCWFDWTAERNRKNQMDYIDSWIEKHSDLFSKPDYLLRLRAFSKSLGLIITDKQEEISIEVDSNEFEMMKNPLEKIESVREEYIDFLVTQCFHFYKWS